MQAFGVGEFVCGEVDVEVEGGGAMNGELGGGGGGVLDGWRERGVGGG